MPAMPKLSQTLIRAALALSALACAPGLAAGPSSQGLPTTNPPPPTSLLLAMAMASGGNALDAVVDVRRPHADGLMVLAVTPGGTGDRIGLRVGDRILEINGRALSGTLEPSKAMAAALSGGRPLEIHVSREGRTLTLSGAPTASPDAGATVQGCGYVTTRGTLPHVSDRLYPVDIVDIDGNGQPIDANRHRLPAGLHVVIVSERIEDIRFDPVQRTQRSRMRAREGARAGKALVVEVRPNMRYRLGARFLDKNLDSRAISGNTYWEPLVWQEVEDACR